MKKKGDIVMKKTAALLTAVMILIAASGCGGGKDTGKSIVDENIQASETEKSESEEAEMKRYPYLQEAGSLRQVYVKTKPRKSS